MKEDESTEQWLKWVLDAINKIRQQKQRPSVERIVNAIKQHEPATESTITNHLDDLVEKGLVLKVINKGKESFKDPGGAHNRFIVVDKDADLIKVVVKAVKDLDDGDGSSLKSVEKYVQQSNCLNIKPGVDLNQVVKNSLKRAVERNLVILDGKYYKGLYDEPKTPKSYYKKSGFDSSPGKPGRKRKSDSEEPPKPKRGLPICSECLGTANKNKAGVEEALSICSGCGASVHPSCAAKGDLFTCLITKGNIWHCEECAVCAKCRVCTDKICIWKCGSCERGYHLDCMNPPLDKKSKSPWKCEHCTDGKEEEKDKNETLLSTSSGSLSSSTSPKKQKILRTQHLRSLRKAARAVGKKGHTRSLSIESSSEDGNDHLPNPSPSYPTSFHLPSGGRRIEISETISKEKQKFFRCSAFYKRYNNSNNNNNNINVNTRAELQQPLAPKINAITPVTPLTQFPRHVPPLNPHSDSKMPFGCFDDSDEPWGFAAVKFEAVKGHNDIFSPREAKGRRWKKDSPVQKSPSSLVKSAVNSKVHELERRKLIGEGCKLMTAHHRLPAEEWNRERQTEAATITSIISNDLPPGVTQKDLETFKTARENAARLTKPNSTSDHDLLVSSGAGGSLRCPASIEFGKHHIHTWYSSPFPQEYARLGKLFLCEFCLKYTKSKAVLRRHLHKCTWRHPPGTEIYRHNNLSVFEVDGNVAKFYCQNLCLLAKLFLDHKTLYYDVEPFLFYVLTKNDDQGFHLVGYFSKEKHCLQKYNVSCIMTLPHYQRQGFGRFLIDFSYLLSKQEGQPGTPEKPLSDLGRVSYHAYWKSVILEYINEHRDESFSISELSKGTGVKAQDIAEMLQIMGMVRPSKVELCESSSKVVVAVDWAMVDAHAERLKRSKSVRIKIEPECLRWTPLIPTLVNPYKNDDDDEDDDDDDDDDEEEEEEETKVDEEEEGEEDEEEKEEEVADLKTKEKVKIETKEVKEEKVKPVLSPKPMTPVPSNLDTFSLRTPKGGSRLKQGFLPELFKKQADVNLKAPKLKPEVPFDEPILDKRRRTKRKYAEVEEDDDVEESNIEPAPSANLEAKQSDRKKKKSVIEPSPLIKPSRLKIPDIPLLTPVVIDSVTEPETTGRRTRRPKVTLEAKEAEEEDVEEESTPKLSKRQIAARERWAKRKQKKLEAENEPPVDQTYEEASNEEELSDASPLRKKKNSKRMESVQSPVKEDNLAKIKTDERITAQTSKESKKSGKKVETPKPKEKSPAKVVEPEEKSEEKEENDESSVLETPAETPPEALTRKRGWAKGVSRKDYTPKDKPKKKPSRQWGVKSRRGRGKKKIAKKSQALPLEDTTDAQSSEIEDSAQSSPRQDSHVNSDSSSDEEELIENKEVPEVEKDVCDSKVEEKNTHTEKVVSSTMEETKDSKEDDDDDDKQKPVLEEVSVEAVEDNNESLSPPVLPPAIEVDMDEEDKTAEPKQEENGKASDSESNKEEETKEEEEKKEEVKKGSTPSPDSHQPEPSSEQPLPNVPSPSPSQSEHKRSPEQTAPVLQPVEPLPVKPFTPPNQVEENVELPVVQQTYADISRPPVLEKVEQNPVQQNEHQLPPNIIPEMIKKPEVKENPFVPEETKKLLPLPMEVDLTQCDDSQSPAKPVVEEQPPIPELVKEKCSPPIEKKLPHQPISRPYEQKIPLERYPSPVKEKKEKKHTSIVVLDDDHVKAREVPREEVPPPAKQPKVTAPSYNTEPPNNSVHSIHPYVTGCGELDVNLGMEPQPPPPNDMLEQQRQLQYSDCAQQSLALHHHHLTPPSHMNMVYQQQRSSKQSVASRSASSNQRQVHHPSSSPHYHQSPNYIMSQGSAYVSVLSHRMQNPPQRLGPSGSCSVSSPNFYLQTQQNSPNSLVKLQQLTNGLDSIPGHCGTMTPPPRVDLTPPPSHATPPPNHYKFYPTNQRHSNISPAPQPRGPHNMLQYNTFNSGYSRQQTPTVTGYITNSAGFINQAAQLPMQMMQSQYPQDPQQNAMYPTYGYHINSPLMQPLNGTMRR